MKRLALCLLLLAPAALAHDLEGFVFAPDGSLLANTKISAYIPAVTREARELVKSATTDASGRFVLTGLPESFLELDAGTTTVTVFPGDPVLTITVGPSPPAPLPVERGEGGRRPGEGSTGDKSISGTIRINKNLMRGVTVRVDPMSEDASPSVTAITDAKGRYVVTGLASARYSVQVGPGLEMRLRTPWTNRMFDERTAPNSIDLTESKTAQFDVDAATVPLITGRVVDHEKKPVLGAEVRVVPENVPSSEFFGYDPQFAIRTLPDGRFAIPAPPFQPEHRVQIAVARPRHSVIRSKAFVFGAGAHNVDITLPRFEPVTVRVTGAGGKPLREAMFTFSPSEERTPMHPEMSRVAPMQTTRGVTTNDAGEAIVHLLPGDYDFAVNAKNHQTKTATDRAVKRGTVVEIALEQSYAIRGRVHRKGKGVQGVMVMIAGQRREATTHTAADGTFEITGLAKETYPIQFMKYEELVDRQMEVTAPAELDVELSPAGTVHGRVIDADTREPVREFMLSIEPLDPPNTRANVRRRGPITLQRNEQGDGTFTATLSAGTYRVNITAVGYTASTPVDVEVREEQPSRVDILLDRGATISGIVTDENGIAVREAAVWVMGESDSPSRSSTMRNMPRAIPVTGRTNETGSFSLSGVESGKAILTVRKEGFVPSRHELDVSGSTRVDVKLSRGITVTGVVTQDGKPLAEAHVNAATAAVGGEHQTAMTDERGRYTLQGLIEGRYSFSAFKETAGHVEVPNIDVSRQREVNIELTAAPRATIYGTVTGIPRTGGKVLRRGVYAQSDQRAAEGTVDESGNYRIENAPTGTVSITAHVETATGGRTSARKQVEVAPRQEVRVDLDVTAAIVVRGRVTQEGRPVAGARVVFSSETNVNGSAIAKEDGSYEVALGEPGTYRIYAHSRDMRTARGFSTIRTIRTDTTIDLDIREQIIEGVVIDATTRQPIADAVVTLIPQDGPRTYISGETITDATGRFTIPIPADGPHTLFTSARGYAYRTQPINLSGTRLAPITFELTRTGELRVRAADARTRTALAAHITVADERGNALPVRGEQSADGTHWIFSLPPGRYRITAVVHGYSQRVLDVTAPGDVELLME